MWFQALNSSTKYSNIITGSHSDGYKGIRLATQKRYEAFIFVNSLLILFNMNTL